jgi:hypothetical protein
MEKLAALPIDWATVNWPYVTALALVVFVCTFLGTALSLGRPILASILTTLLFGTAFIFWTYYPHDLPLPIFEKVQKTPAAATTQSSSSSVPANEGRPARPDNTATTNHPPSSSLQR